MAPSNSGHPAKTASCTWLPREFIAPRCASAVTCAVAFVAHGRGVVERGLLCCHGQAATPRVAWDVGRGS
eukprot:4364141-Prymnesium_polylepis.1